MAVLWSVFGILVCFFSNLTQCLAYVQDDYTVKMEILRVVDYNRSYLRQPKADLVWFNRTTRTMNISAYLLKDVNKGYRAYKFASNEYRFFPITINMPICNEVLQDPFGIFNSLKDSVNFNFSCPFKKGFYAVKYGRLNFTRFPPHIPSGRYRNQIKLFDKSNFIVEFFLDVEHVDVIKKWEKKN